MLGAAKTTAVLNLVLKMLLIKNTSLLQGLERQGSMMKAWS